MSKMIYFKVDKLLNKYKLSNRKLALECNIRPSTLKLYVDNVVKRINVTDLENIYNFFYELDDRFTINDLIEIKDKTSYDTLKRLDIFSEYKSNKEE
ncbi:XRE family transcriptional regulator [Clostridium botulinum]|uniref:XRE family transcriptional regulator n=1 Tax=Clostridium botulinum TaxID=1491 RepID=UPI001C9A76AB|nr:XRE family transcriptional regulator [Clostridium botulinum]MBY6838849.1 XRE family transcriptional regulator [Clostridium botulinum]